MFSIRIMIGVAFLLLLTPLVTLAGRTTSLQQINPAALPMWSLSEFGATTATLNGDGSVVLFRSELGLVAGDVNEAEDLYVYDRDSGELEFLGNPESTIDDEIFVSGAFITNDGRFVIFGSSSPYYVDGDENDVTDVFRYDRTTREYVRLNPAAAGDAHSAHPVAISGDGRFVATETGTPYVSEDVNGEDDLYILDMVEGTVERLHPRSGEFRTPSMSDDGRYVAFSSFADDLVEDDTNENADVFALDRANGAITRISVTGDGQQVDGRSWKPSISSNGRYVAFESTGALLAANEFGAGHVYLYDLETDDIEQIDLSSDGESAIGASPILSEVVASQAVSADGRYVAFSSSAPNLTPNDTNGTTDVFRRDRISGRTELVSQSFAGTVGESYSGAGALSADGRYVVFISEASNIVYLSEDDGIVQGYGDKHIYVRDMQTPYPPSPFGVTHSRTDLPVAQGQAQRTWTWGPEPFTDVLYEPYGARDDSNIVPFEHRAVQYYDKARMEITTPTGDPNSIWYVTNGLLVVEMMTGELQVSDAGRMQVAPAWVNVAGDANDPSGPTYATLAGLRDAPAHPSGQPIIARVNRDGEVINDPALASFDVRVALVDDVTSHGIAAPFWEFMNSSGTVWNGSSFVQDQLFENAYFATGRPVIEAYWAEVLVGGQPREVLMQCFERRCLTYTPGNPEGFIVEAGNVGLHYYNWRYSLQPLTPDLTGKVVSTDGSHLNVIDETGAVEVFQAPEGLEISAPAWSPDGSQIAFLLGRGFSAISGSGDIYVMNADGGDLRQLTFDQEADAVSWSPSGDRLVFGADGMVTIINADGAGRTTIGSGIKPAWSPVDENKLAFIQPGNVELLMTMDASGGSVQEVTAPPAGGRASFLIFRGYSWSPDGTQFVYSGIFQRTASTVVEYRTLVVNADGTDSRHIETGGSEGYNPGWSPDGSQVTYAREHIVYRVNPDGSEVRGLLWDFDEHVADYDWIGSD